MRLCFLFLFLTFFTPIVFGAVPKKKLSEDVQKGIVAVFKAQLDSGQLSFKEDPNDEMVESKLQQHSQLWDEIINLLPEDHVSDDAAVWIMSSAIRRATFFGPYFISAHSNNTTVTQTFQYDQKEDAHYRDQISKEMPLLTSARLSHIFKQRKEWLIEANDYYTKWRRMVLQFMMKPQTMSIADPYFVRRLSLASEKLLKFANETRSSNFIDYRKPSLTLTSALASHVDKRLRLGYSSIYDSVDYTFSPLYYSELFPCFNGIRPFEEVDSTLEQKLSNSLNTVNDRKVLSGRKLDRVLWDVAQLQIRFKPNQKVSSKQPDVEPGNNLPENYVSFTNEQSIWEKMIESKVGLYDPESLNVLKNALRWNFDMAEVVRNATE